MIKWIIGALVGVIVMICAFILIDPNASFVSTNSMETNSENTLVNKINVRIEGAVVNPGIYTLEESETLQDLISSAGGLLSTADETCFDLSLDISSYELFYIPYEAGYAEECVPITTTKVNINTATSEEISTVNGISETLAAKIVEYRETNGNFKSLEELMLVTGIGSKTYEKIRDFICIK